MPNVQTKTSENVWQRVGKIMWPKQPMLCVLRSQNGCKHMGWPARYNEVVFQDWNKMEWRFVCFCQFTLTLVNNLRLFEDPPPPPPPPSQWRKYAKPMKYIYPKPSYEDLGSGWEGEEEKKRSKIKRSGSVQKFAKRQSYTSALKAVIFSQIALLQRELHLPEHKLPVKTTSSHTQRKWRKMQSIFVASDDSRINLSK